MIGLALLALTPSEAVRQAVALHESVPAADVEVTEVGAIANPPAGVPWTVRLPEETGLCGSVPVVLEADGHRYATRASVAVWRDVPVAETAAAPGQEVHVTTARRSCSALHGETSVDATHPWEAAVSLAAGSPVTTARVRALPDVRRGAGVRIESSAGALTVAAPGELLQDGFIGGRVTVLNLATRAVLAGTYSDAGVVTVKGP